MPPQPAVAKASFSQSTQQQLIEGMARGGHSSASAALAVVVAPCLLWQPREPEEPSAYLSKRCLLFPVAAQANLS